MCCPRVSASTVSRTYDHPELVKASTRRKIDNAVRRLGYIRNRAAQTIHGIRSGTIGLVVPTIDHAIFAELIQSFSEAIDRFGFTILLANHGYDLQREYALVRKMLEHKVDGVALIGLEHADETFSLIERQAIPSILLWNHADQSLLPCVGTNNFQAGKLIGRHVIEQGHRDIALIFPPLEGNDVQAWGALNAASRFDLAISKDISVTGIGDFKGSKDLEPALTTVRIPARQIGKQAATTIARAITEPDMVAESQNLPPDLMDRGTCRAI